MEPVQTPSPPLTARCDASCLPLITKLTRKAVQVVNIVLGPHHHLKGRDELTTGSTVSSYTKEPGETQIIFQTLTERTEVVNRDDANAGKLLIHNVFCHTQVWFILAVHVNAIPQYISTVFS